MERARFDGFKANEFKEGCEEFARGHVAVLQKYKITNITTNNLQWFTHPGMFVISAKNTDGQVIGGIRLQSIYQGYKLPVQTAISYLDAQIDEIIEAYPKYKTAEICALWNSPDYAKQGVSKLLFHAAIALCPIIGIESLVTICAEYTVKMVENVGFKTIRSIGDNGLFSYPTPEYQARVLVLDDVVNMPDCDPEIRDHMMTLRDHNFDTELTMPTGYNFIISYEYRELPREDRLFKMG